MPRGYFAISAVSKYAAIGDFDNGEFDDLEFVADEARTMRATLAGLGLVELFSADGGELTHPALADRLEQWSQQFNPETPVDELSTLVLYCTGHGAPDDVDGWRLVPPEPNQERKSRWTRPADLLQPLLDKRRDVKQVVLVLDACFSGDGAREALTRSLEVSLIRGSTTGIWVLAAARRTDRAQQRVFAEAFAEALRRAAQNLNEAFLDPSTVTDVTAAVMRRRGSTQVPWVAAGYRAGGCRALPNPRYMPPTPPEWIERRWSAPARGVQEPGDPGWYFTGRHAVLQRLVRHLTSDVPGRPLLLLTGAAGTGKTAVLARLLTTATAGQRRAMPTVARQGYLPETDLTAVLLDVAGLRVEQAAAELARRLGMSSDATTDVLQALADRNRRQAIMIDHLDRAVDPITVAGQLVLPLSAIPTVRLVVASAPTQDAAFQGIEQLDVGAFDEETLLERYVILRLEYGLAVSGTAARRGLTRTASALAQSCLGNFAAAVIAVDTLLEEVLRAGRPMRDAQEAAKRAANRLLDALCRAAMAQTGTAAVTRYADGLVQCLSAACAYSAEGWLPEPIWAGVARRTHGTPYTGDEVGARASSATAFLDKCRSETGERAWRPRFGAVTVDRSAAGDQLVRHVVHEARDYYGAAWEGVHPGLAAILLGAAGEAHGRFGDLLDDAQLLLAAPPAQVTRSLRSAHGRPDGQRRVVTWAGVPVHAKRRERAFKLELLARRNGLSSLAATAAVSGESGSPRCRWAVRVSSSGRYSPVTSMALAGPDGAHIVTAHGDGLLAWWDGITGEQVSAWPPDGVSIGPIDAVSAALTDAGLITVAVGGDRDVRCWGPAAGLPPRSLGSATVAIAHASGLVATADGRAVMVADAIATSGARDFGLPAEIVAAAFAGVADEPVLWLVDLGGRIWRWDLSGTGARQPSLVSPGLVPLLLAASRDGESCAVVGTDGGLSFLTGSRTVFRPQSTRDIRSVAMNERWLVLSGGPDARSGWFEVHDAARNGPGTRWPLDAAPVGSELADETLVVATPDGLMAITLADGDVRTGTTAEVTPA